MFEMSRDRDIINVSLVRALAFCLITISASALVLKNTVIKAVSIMGQRALLFPVVGVLCLIFFMIFLYVLLIFFSAFCRGGMLKIRNNSLVYLNIFRIPLDKVSNLSIRKVGPLSVKSVVVTMKSGKAVNLSAFLSDVSEVDLSISE